MMHSASHETVIYWSQATLYWVHMTAISILKIKIDTIKREMIVDWQEYRFQPLKR